MWGSNSITITMETHPGQGTQEAGIAGRGRGGHRQTMVGKVGTQGSPTGYPGEVPISQGSASPHGPL